MAFLPAPSLLLWSPCSRAAVCPLAARGAGRRSRRPAHACSAQPSASSSASAAAGHGGDDASTAGSQSVSGGVLLPEADAAAVDAQTAELELGLRHWLDAEFPTDEAMAAHRAIARRAALLYRRRRADGERDLTTLVLDLGGELELADADFHEAFVGPWNVANKAGELLIQQNATARAAGNEPAPGQRDGADAEEEEKGGDEFPLTEAARQAGDGYYGMDADAADEVDGAHAVPAELDDSFAKYRFMQLVLDGDVTPARINGAVAQEVGFVYDAASQRWSGAKVTDGHFAQFGDAPPDVLGDEGAAQWTATLAHMETMVRASCEGDTAKEALLADGIQTLIETLNGFENTKLRQADPADHAFTKRSMVVQWLHMVANYC